MDEKEVAERWKPLYDIYNRQRLFFFDMYAEKDIPSLVAEVQRLRDLLTTYGRHQEGCNAAHGDQYRCRCGWREVEASLPGK